MRAQWQGCPEGSYRPACVYSLADSCSPLSYYASGLEAGTVNLIVYSVQFLIDVWKHELIAFRPRLST